MTGFITVKICDRPHHVTVFRHDDAFFDPAAQTVGGCFGHLPGGFAGRYQQNPAGKAPAFQCPPDGCIRLNGGNCFPHDGVCVGA